MDKKRVTKLPINLSDEFCPHAIGNVLHNLSCKMAATGNDDVENFAEELAKSVKLLWQLPCLTAIQQIWRHCDSEANIATLRGNDNRKLRAENAALREKLFEIEKQKSTCEDMQADCLSPTVPRLRRYGAPAVQQSQELTDITSRRWSKEAEFFGSGVQPSPAVAMPDHIVAQTINSLRDIAIEFHGAQQLRERIAGVIRPLLSTPTPLSADHIEQPLIMVKQSYTVLETIEGLREASDPNARDPLEILGELHGTKQPDSAAPNPVGVIDFNSKGQWVLNFADNVDFEAGQHVYVHPFANYKPQRITEQDYKAQRDELLKNLKNVVDIDCPLIGSPSLNELIQFWQHEHEEGRGIAETMLDALKAIAQCEGQGDANEPT